MLTINRSICVVSGVRWKLFKGKWDSLYDLDLLQSSEEFLMGDKKSRQPMADGFELHDQLLGQAGDFLSDGCEFYAGHKDLHSSNNFRDCRHGRCDTNIAILRIFAVGVGGTGGG